MTLQLAKNGVQLLLDSGSLANHSDCCCDCSGQCTTPRVFPTCVSPNIECVDAAFGNTDCIDNEVQVDLDVELTGLEFRNSVHCVPDCVCPTGSIESINPTGSYVLDARGDTYVLQEQVLFCEYDTTELFPNVHRYVWYQLETTIQTGTTAGLLRVTVQIKGSLEEVEDDPTPPSFLSGNNRWYLQHDYTLSLVDDWAWEPGAMCIDACNEVTQRYLCVDAGLEIPEVDSEDQGVFGGGPDITSASAEVELI